MAALAAACLATVVFCILDQPVWLAIEPLAGALVAVIVAGQAVRRWSPMPELVLSRPGLTLQSGRTQAHLEWEQVHWLICLPSIHSHGDPKRGPMSEDLLIRCTTRPPGLSTRRGARLRWDEAWHGVRFHLGSFRDHPKDLAAAMASYAGDRWLGVGAIPCQATPEFTLRIPGYRQPPAIAWLQRHQRRLVVLIGGACAVLGGIADSPLVNDSLGAGLSLLRQYAVTGAGILVPVMAIPWFTGRHRQRCDLVVTADQLAVGGIALPWRSLAAVEVASAPADLPANQFRWDLRAILSPSREALTLAVIQSAPSATLPTLDVNPEQLARSLGAFRTGVAVTRPTRGSVSNYRWNPPPPSPRAGPSPLRTAVLTACRRLRSAMRRSTL
jgi:hypothetical protein